MIENENVIFPNKMTYIIKSKNGDEFEVSEEILRMSGVWNRAIRGSFTEKETKSINTDTNTRELQLLLSLMNINPIKFDRSIDRIYR